MNSSFHALWMLCGLAAAVFATAASTWRSLAALVAGFAATAVFVLTDQTPDILWTSRIVVLMAALQILRPADATLSSACAGTLAAIWGSLLHFQGLPFAPALAIAAGLPLLSAMLTTRHPVFAPARLRDEAMLLVFGFALVVAIMPELSAGWRSAITLNLAESKTTSQILPAWVLTLTAASVGLGGLYSLWVRR